MHQRVLVAGLLTNAEALMPHFLLQLLEFASSMPAGHVFISVYESGSTDKTGMGLVSLAFLSACMGVFFGVAWT